MTVYPRTVQWGPFRFGRCGIGKLDAVEDALAGEPWAFTRLLQGIPDVLDTEGRPLGERRASPPAKVGVEIELRPCPYSDARRGQPMNLSALKQVMAHWDDVVGDIQTFHRQLPATLHGRFRFLALVADQLARPAAFLLEVGDPRARVPAARAVAHKLAAGFFGAANGQLPELSGGSPRARTEQLLAEVFDRELLFGASEVCAGPLNLIERASVALVTSDAAGTEPSTPRAERAVLLATQLRVGTFSTAEDEAFERELLSLVRDGSLRPRNDYMRRAIERRSEELAARPLTPNRELTIPEDACPEILTELRSATSDPEGFDRRCRDPIVEALAHPADAALEVTPAVRSRLIEETVRYLARRRATIRVQWRLEMALRATFRRRLEGALRPNALLLPSGGAGRWLDAALGHRIEMRVDPEPAVRLWNPKRSIKV